MSFMSILLNGGTTGFHADGLLNCLIAATASCVIDLWMGFVVTLENFG